MDNNTSIKNDQGNNTFKNFQMELENWYNTGTNPASADENMSEYLSSLRRRLENYGITAKIKIKSKEMPLFASQFTSAAQDKLISTYYQTVKRKIEFSQGKKKLYAKKQDALMCQKFISPRIQGQEEDFRVHDFDWMKKPEGPNDKVNKLMKILIKIAVGLGIAAALLLQLIIGELSFSVTIFAFVFVAFPAGFLLGAIYLILSAAAGGLSVAKAYKDQKEVNSITGEGIGDLRKYDFSYTKEYFKERGWFLAKRLILRDDPGVYTIYEGNDLAGKFADIIETRYGDQTKIYSAEKIGDRLIVNLGILLNNLVYNNGKIMEKSEMINMNIYHEDNTPVDAWKVSSIERSAK